MIVIFATIATVHGQVGSSSSPVSSASPDSTVSQSTQADQAYQADVDTFCANQLSLVQQQSTLIAQGETADQLSAWVQQDAVQFQFQVQSAQTLSAYSEAQPMTLFSDLEIPADASDNLATLLTTQAELYNDLAQIHNQLLTNPSPGQDEMTLFAQ